MNTKSDDPAVTAPIRGNQELVIQKNGMTLGIQFQFRRDRFVHQIWWGADRRVLLESVETTRPESGCPASPPVQEIVSEQHGQQTVLLAVGQASKNHWSGAISGGSQLDRLTLELACRVNRPGTWLGSSYQIGATAHVEFCTVDDKRLVLAVANHPALTLRADNNSRLKLDPDHQSIEILPCAAADQIPTTATWTYSIEFETGD